jgi:hypothetical protein
MEGIEGGGDETSGAQAAAGNGRPASEEPVERAA